MLLNSLITLIICLIATPVLAVSQAFTDGQTAAIATIGNTAGGVTQSNVDAVGQPFTGNTTALQNSFDISNAGNTGLFDKGKQQLADCQNQPANVPVNEKQYCDGVNSLALNPLQNARNQTGITKADPIFTDPNNAYNLGLSNASTTDPTIGSGTPQNGVGGAAGCLTTSTTTPPVYTTRYCDRAVGLSTQSCIKTLAPTVTSEPFCDISGTAQVISSDPAGVLGKGGATGKPFYDITFGCASVSTGKATITPTWSGAWGTWSTGGAINVGWYPNTINFQPGYSSQPVSWWSGINYDGWGLVYTTAWYDGPSNRIRVTNSPPQYDMYQQYLNPLSLGGTPVTCDPGYTYGSTNGNITIYIYDANWGSIYSSTITPSLSFCSKSTDAASRVIAAPAPIIPNSCPSGTNLIVGSNLNVIYDAAALCLTDYIYPISLSGTICPYGMSLIQAGVCGAPTGGYTYAFSSPPAGTCDNNHNYIILGDSKAICYPKNIHLQNFGQSNTAYSGSAGIRHLLTNSVNDTCSVFQAQTSTPTAYPATAVNGVYTCPTGMTVSGANCI